MSTVCFYFSGKGIYSELQKIGRDNGSDDGDIGPYDDDGDTTRTCRPIIRS